MEEPTLDTPAAPQATSRLTLFFQCLAAILVFMLLLIKLIVLSPILILTFAQLAVRTCSAWNRKRLGKEDLS